MKWRRKKSSARHAPQPQIFPISWLSKLKQMSSSTKTKRHPPVNAKPKVKPESPRSSNIPVCFRPPRRSDVGSNSPGRERIRKNQTEFMLPGEDMWRSSLRMQSSESEGSGGFSEDKSAVQFLSCDSFRSNGKSAAKEIYEFSEAGKFGDMLSEVKKMKFKTRLEKERSKSVDYRFETPKWIAEHEYLRTADKRIPEDDMIFCRRSFHEDHVSMKREQKVLDPLSGKAISIDRRRSDSSTDMGHHKSLSLSLNLRRLNQRIMKDDSTILSNSEKKLVKDDQEIEIVPSKSNKRGGGEPNSCQGNRDSNKRKIGRRPRARVQSPRAAMRMETCKIRAVEELKKAKKKREKQRGRAFESFAVVKCSFNPHQDFRESMVEMIAENGIRHPEELERLLACYLSLNSEEYHSLIVKVFRQVWFDLNIDSSVTEFEERHYY